MCILLTRYYIKQGKYIPFAFSVISWLSLGFSLNITLCWKRGQCMCLCNGKSRRKNDQYGGIKVTLILKFTFIESLNLLSLSQICSPFFNCLTLYLMGTGLWRICNNCFLWKNMKNGEFTLKEQTSPSL